MATLPTPFTAVLAPGRHLAGASWPRRLAYAPRHLAVRRSGTAGSWQAGAPDESRRWAARSASAFGVRVLFCVALVAGLNLAVWSLLPMLWGWTPVVITSGSMAPGIQPGDVVFFERTADADLRPGRVIVFDDPSRPGTLLSHRLHQRAGTDSLITKGDANAVADPVPVPVHNVEGAARLVVPYVGLVSRAVDPGQWPWQHAIAGLLAVSAVAVAFSGQLRRRRAHP